MKETIRITSVLTLVCVVCAFSLSFIYKAASEKINVNAQKRIQDAITNIAPDTKLVKKQELQEEELYKLFNKDNDFIGYAFIAQGQGYQGKIKILAVSNTDLTKLIGIEVVESVETPGLGAKIQGAAFQKQFQNLTTLTPISYTKDEVIKKNQIKAITGATVSSRAVINILNKKIEALKAKLNP